MRAIAALLLLASVAHAQEEAPPAEPPSGEAPVETPSEPEAPPTETVSTPPTTTTSSTTTATSETASEPVTASATATVSTPRREPPAQDAPIPEYSRTRPDEEEEEEEDTVDHYDFLWIELAGGISYVDLRAIDAENFYPEFVRLSGWGPVGSLALGFRIEFLSVGLRASLARYDASDMEAPDAVFDVGTATAEIGLALPLPIVKPFLRVGFGLGWHGDSNFDAPDMSQTTVFGFVFSGTVGVDFYFADWFAIGAAGTVDILNMNRQTIDEPISDPGEVRFEDTGDAVGAQGRATIAVSFHL